MAVLKYVGIDPIEVTTETQHVEGQLVTLQTNDIINVSHREFFLVNKGLSKDDFEMAIPAPGTFL